ncbi:hypothetical protein GCM10009802_40320 [Streptomyces synnematoformans]|uniref:Uncharacterized protein n=1 Tax=Streptomyces synnematoformans TaxID=415721 RepID=A0ABN2YTT6_9ACTN
MTWREAGRRDEGRRPRTGAAPLGSGLPSGEGQGERRRRPEVRMAGIRMARVRMARVRMARVRMARVQVAGGDAAAARAASRRATGIRNGLHDT